MAHRHQCLERRYTAQTSHKAVVCIPVIYMSKNGSVGPDHGGFFTQFTTWVCTSVLRRGRPKGVFWLPGEPLPHTAE